MDIAQLQQQNDRGFRRLRFAPELEQAYREVRDEGIRQRARPVSASALALFLIYALLDAAMLPASIASDTVMIRLLITCPLIAVVWWLSYTQIRAATFARLYAGAYLIGGLSVVAIIALARLRQHDLPYEGILLMLMFGYLVMGIPFRSVSLMSLAVIVAYISMEYATGMSAQQLLINSFFIATANVMGMVGSWLSEYRQRAHFLDRQMLEQSRRQAERESQRKTRLITVASHDLRQPLNVVSLILEHLDGDPLPPQPASLVSKLKASVAHFHGLLASVLDISRIQEGMIVPQLQSLDLGPTLEQIRDTCGDQAQRLGVSLNLSPGESATPVIADPQLLYRILQNLISNALEHSGATSIDVTTARVDDHLRIEISDNGCGMDHAGETHAFDPFYRKSSGSELHPGLGLGLAIVRELSHMMNGNCGVRSAPGQGSRFWVSLPAGVNRQPDSKTSVAAPGPDTDAHHFLVVEDHDEARHWVCETLKHWGFAARGFATAKEALAGRHGSGGSHDAILVTDLHLPDMPGRTLHSLLTARGTTCGGILMTADTGLPEGYDAGQRLWVLHKPLVPMRLRAAITQLTRPLSPGP
ncbi:response regulator [Marinobacter lipolyticus]|uniref:hybrid sensor histidine kinase/response regulator n=1 Tax=Marinobacter lipolyticus TaxID=209639 RepID=UPI001BCB35DF|nr:hybrid sensor histidine kinase/response regulator [Marinobacter lipolyticus]MBS8240325.1 response regulator [Marinobacter lipolyticus]